MGFFSGIKNFFKKVGTGISRSSGSSIPYTPAEKRVGNYGEEEVYDSLSRALPEATIFRSVVLDENLAKGEIDFLVIYKFKVFVVELKTWRGDIYQEGEQFYQDKESSAGETYTNELGNPFRQVKRNVYLIKQQFKSIWFEPAIIFIEADSVNIDGDISWFESIDSFVNFVKNSNIRTNHDYQVASMIKKIKCYDKMIGKSWFDKELSCIIDEESLHFVINGKEIFKKDILSIRVNHHFSYDDVSIELKNHERLETRMDNYQITYRENGKRYKASFSKIDSIAINLR